MNPEKRQPQDGSRPRQAPQSQQADAKRRRGQIIRQRIFILATVLAALIVLAYAVWHLIFVKPDLKEQTPILPTVTSSGGESQETEIWSGTVPKQSGDRKEEFYTFLVIGRDTGGGGNTDTILLAAYNVKHQELNVMSIPRDTMVNIPYDIKRINAVYNYAGGGDKGIQELNKEISQLVGFVPDFQVVVEWEAVGELVDAIGGVYFDVPRNMNYEDPTQDLSIHIKKGPQRLNGAQAMGVIRYRHDNDKRYGYPDGDLGRIKTQQAFLKAVVEQCLQFQNVTKIGELSEVFSQNVTTNLTVNNLFWFGKEAIMGGLQMDHVTFVTMPNTGAKIWSRTYQMLQDYVVPNTDELVELVNQSFNPYLDDLKENELDIMYVNRDGTIGSSTGVVEDKKANQTAYWGGSSGSGSGSGSGTVSSASAKPQPTVSAKPEPSPTPPAPLETKDPIPETPPASPEPEPSGTLPENPLISQLPVVSLDPFPSHSAQPLPEPSQALPEPSQPVFEPSQPVQTPEPPAVSESAQPAAVPTSDPGEVQLPPEAEQEPAV